MYARLPKSIPLDRLGKRLGRRGAALLLLGGIYALVGIGHITTDPGDAVQAAAYAFPLQFFPLSFWGGMFVMVGVIAAFTGFMSVGRDAWGFMVLAGLSIIWAAFGFFTAFGLGEFPRGWLTGVSWTAIAGLILIISGMRGPNDE